MSFKYILYVILKWLRWVFFINVLVLIFNLIITQICFNEIYFLLLIYWEKKNDCFLLSCVLFTESYKVHNEAVASLWWQNASHNPSLSKTTITLRHSAMSLNKTNERKVQGPGGHVWDNDWLISHVRPCLWRLRQMLFVNGKLFFLVDKSTMM